jgi:adhesin transport system outer membrane protein
MKNWLLRLQVVAVLGWWPRAGAAEVVALAQLERLALQNRPALAADAARERAAQADIDKAQSGYYPQLTLQAQSALGPRTRLLDIVDKNGDEALVQGAHKLDQAGAFDPQLRHELGLQLDGNLYDFGRTRAALDAGRARKASAEAQEQATRAQIVRGVRGAYLMWLSSSELQAIAAQAASEAQSRRARVEALIGEGVRPKADLSAARADEMLAALELERASGELRAARMALAQAVGSELPGDAQPDRTLLQAELPVEPARDDAALRALQQQRLAASASARAKEQGSAPLLRANLMAGARALGSTLFPAYVVGLSFSLPLWDGGGAAASAAAERAHAQELAELGRQHVQERSAAVDRAALDASNAVARLQTAQALLDACQQHAAEAEQSYELGSGSIDQLAQARALLRRARTEVVLARVSRAEAALRVRGL